MENRKNNKKKTPVGKTAAGFDIYMTRSAKRAKATEDENTTERTEKKLDRKASAKGMKMDKIPKWNAVRGEEKEQSRKKDKPTRVNKENRETKKAKTNFCELEKKCGACSFHDVSYEKQLKNKQNEVEKLMEKYCKVLPIIGMEDPLHYRNKVSAAFSRLRNGTIISGVYKEGTHTVVNVDSCMIEDKVADEIICDIRGMLKSFKIKTYDEDTQYGLLRHVMVRRGFQSGQIMVVLVVSSPIFPSKNNFVKALRKLHPEIETVVLNVNDKKTSMVLGERNITLYGKGFIEDTLCGLTFRISPSSFYQVNPVQTEKLYGTAMKYAHLTGEERVLDAYCGIGTIGMVAAKNAKEVLGVELNRSAVRDAVTNAKRNSMKNIKFYNADAGEFMVDMAEKKDKVDVVFMDPPRAGSDEAFLSSIMHLGPKRVVYISCNPETLARDTDYLTKHGYDAIKCQPVDMFPYTEHCENVVLFER